jgi:hypothetical protein
MVSTARSAASAPMMTYAMLETHSAACELASGSRGRAMANTLSTTE